MTKRSAADKAPASARKQERLREVIQGAENTKAPEPMERIIHERIRLAIVSALAVNTSMTFKELKKLLATTDGNLSVHARKLEEAEYIHCNKSFENRMPKTEYRLTAKGKKALQRYLSHMEALINAVRKG